MALLYTFTPFAAEMPASNFGALGVDGQGRAYLAYDTTTSESNTWPFEMPTFTGPLVAKVKFRAASATSGTYAPDFSLEAITPGDAVDTDSSSSFATANAGTATTVPATAGYVGEVSVTLTNDDSVAAGDYCRLKLARNTANDNASGDIQVLEIALYDAA